jgi:predicted enzyme related to lactoylglutathione lyase
MLARSTRTSATEEPMGEVKSYPSGTFCWIELVTTDVPGAKAFYSGLFGWELIEPIPGRKYAFCMVDGKLVTALNGRPDGSDAWTSYISVDDLDATVATATKLGASVTTERRDIAESGSLAALQDPTGAAVWLWQPGTDIGAKLVNEINTWGWNELVTPDLDAAAAFYGTLFGWDVEDAPGPIRRAGFTLGNLLVGGVHEPSPQENGAPQWIVTFRVADADASVARVEQLGGSVLLPPLDVPVGRFAVVADPAGAAFVLTQVPGGPVRGADGS